MIFNAPNTQYFYEYNQNLTLPKRSYPVILLL
jgi:hypothetical protein